MSPPPAVRRRGGPKTLAGKATAARNSTVHGIFSRRTLLPHESAEEFDAFTRALWERLAPQGALEALFADRAVSSAWRLARAIGVENAAQAKTFVDAFLRREHELPLEERTRRGQIASVANEWLDKVHRYEATLERQLYAAVHELQCLQASRLTGVPLVPGSLRVSFAAPGPTPPSAPAAVEARSASVAKRTLPNIDITEATRA